MQAAIHAVLTLFSEVLQRSSCFQTPDPWYIFDIHVLRWKYLESTKITA